MSKNTTKYGPITETGRAVLPAGTYVVGDPCYSIPDEKWMDWLRDGNHETEDRIVCAKVGGRWAVGVYTAFGDGSYFDQSGQEYPVDAGMIGLVPVEVANLDEFDEDFGQIVTFEDDVEARFGGKKSTIHLGHIAIDTDPDLDPDW